MAQKNLTKYRQMRDFEQTAEPSGSEGLVAKSNRRRYVIQKHAATRLHFDFRLELDGVFKSWAVTRGPSNDPADKRLAVEVEDHPLEYGDFEGIIPKGQYGGGTVQLWDRGYWEPEGEKSPEEQMKKGDFKFTLDGERLKGSWVLVRMKFDRNGGKRTNWLLIKHRDQYAQEGGAEKLIAQETSVASGRKMAQIAAGKGKAPKPLHAEEDPGAEDHRRRGLGQFAQRRRDGAAEEDREIGAGAEAPRDSTLGNAGLRGAAAGHGHRPPAGRRGLAA